MTSKKKLQDELTVALAECTSLDIEVDRAYGSARSQQDTHNRNIRAMYELKLKAEADLAELTDTYNVDVAEYEDIISKLRTELAEAYRAIELKNNRNTEALKRIERAKQALNEYPVKTNNYKTQEWCTP